MQMSEKTKTVSHNPVSTACLN